MSDFNPTKQSIKLHKGIVEVYPCEHKLKETISEMSEVVNRIGDQNIPISENQLKMIKSALEDTFKQAMGSGAQEHMQRVKEIQEKANKIKPTPEQLAA